MQSPGSDISLVVAESAVADEKSNETIQDRIKRLKNTINSIRFDDNYAQSQLSMALLSLLEAIEGTSAKNNKAFNHLIACSLSIVDDFKTHLNPPQGVLDINQSILIDELNAFQNKSLHFSYFSKLPYAINQVVVAGCGVLDVAPPIPKPRYPWLRSILENVGFILVAAFGMLTGGLLGGMFFPGLGIGFGMLAGLGFGAAFGFDFLGLSNLWFGSKKGKILGALAVTIGSTGIGAGLGALLGTVALPGMGTTFGALIGAGFGSLSGIFLAGFTSLFRGQGQLSRYFGSLSTTLSAAAMGAGAGF